MKVKKTRVFLLISHLSSKLSDTGRRINFQLRDLEQQRCDLEATRSSLEDELNVLRKRVEVLDGVAGQVMLTVSTFFRKLFFVVRLLLNEIFFSVHFVFV